MADRPVPVHYLRPNEAEWSPATVAFLDCETTPVMVGDDELHRLRLWCARLVRRRPTVPNKSPSVDGQGTTTAELVAWLDQAAKGERSVWLYAHNLAFDLTATGLMGALLADGWTCTDFSLSSDSPWFRLAKGSKRLCLTDSWSWLPVSLERIGGAVKVRKPDLPRFEEGDDAWFHRCRGDVDILATAVLDLMDWWDRDHLGRWTITGAHTGWNAMRHRTRAKAVLIDPDDEARAFERRANRGGRRDAWRYGTFRAGPYVELDFQSAHATIASGCLLPCRRTGRFDTLSLEDPIWSQMTRGVIAEAVISTAEPRYPVKVDHRNVYPTGTFTTVLASPELKMAQERGELVSVGRGYTYRLDGHLMDWARWVLALSAGQLEGAPKVAQLAGRHWSRAVIGKWAARGSTTIPLGPATHPTWHVEDGYDTERQARAQLVDVGERCWWVIHDQETENSFPAVLAWVESELRVRLARVLDTLGHGLVLQCDTDGFILDAGKLFGSESRRRLRLAQCHNPRTAARSLARRLSRLTAPLTLRLKGEYDHLVILGPQQMRLDNERRMAGIRSDAKEADDGSFTAHTWPKLSWQMKEGDPRGYVRPKITTRLEGPYIARWYLANGDLFAPQAAIDANGETRLLPFSELNPRPHFDLPADIQHPLFSESESPCEQFSTSA